MNLAINTKEKLHAAVYFLLLAIDRRYPKHRTDSVEHELHKREVNAVIQWQSWRLLKIIRQQRLEDMPEVRSDLELLPPLKEFSFFDMFFESDEVPIPDSLQGMPEDIASMLMSMNSAMEQAMVMALVEHLNQVMPRQPMPSGRFIEMLSEPSKKTKNRKTRFSLKK